MPAAPQSWVIARRILRYLQPHRALLGASFACMVVLAATTSAYAYLTGPLLAFLLTGGNRGLGVLARWAPQLFAQLDRERALVALPVTIVAVAVLKGAAYLGQFYGMGILGQRVVASLRRDLVARFLALSPPWFEKQHTGDLLSRFTTDVAAIELFATYGVASVLRDTTQIVSLLVLAMALDWRLSLLALGVVPLAAVPVGRIAQRLRRSVRAGQDSLGRLGARVQEGLWGLRVLQAYGAEAQELVRFDRENAEYLRQQRASIRSRALAPALVELLVVAALAGTMAFAARAVAAGTLQAEVLVSFIATMALLYQPAKDLGRVSPWLLQATAGAERVFEVLDATDPLGAVPPSAPTLPRLEHALTFENLDLRYAKKPVLTGFSLEVKRGEVVGLVGESGGGKSTAVKLALRFLDPSSGAVRVDGVDLRTVSLTSARAQFALVTQEPLLFDDTVRANLAYARPDATDSEVERVAQMAGADTFIRALPQGYATPIGERGVRLSGGQKQRLALARALLADAPVLILDEATSSLDPESERAVQTTLDAALQGRTALVVAHRLSAVRRATRIAVLRGGRIAELGTHSELIALGGEYARMCAWQGEAEREAS